MSSTEEKTQAFAEPDAIKLAGFDVRPITAQSLHFLQHTKNGLVSQAPKADDPDFFYHIASFIFLHSEPVDRIKDLLTRPDEYRDQVIDLMGKINVKDLIDAAGKIKTLLDKSMVGNDYEILEEDGGKGNDPN